MRITVDEGWERWRRGDAVFVDARSPAAWERAVDRLPHAVRIAADEVDAHVAELNGGRAIVTYCT